MSVRSGLVSFILLFKGDARQAMGEQTFSCDNKSEFTVGVH